MAIPLEYKPLVQKILDRSRSGTGKWNESARIDQYFQVVDSHALLTYRTDPTEGPVQISVTILDRMGNPVYREMLQPGDPDFDTLSELNDLAKRSVEGTASLQG